MRSEIEQNRKQVNNSRRLEKSIHCTFNTVGKNKSRENAAVQDSLKVLWINTSFIIICLEKYIHKTCYMNSRSVPFIHMEICGTNQTRCSCC